MKKLLGGIFLISGTAIGGGIILLPAVIGIYGYVPAIILLLLVWLMNVLIAFTFLEANFYLPIGTSMVSMTKVFFGKHMQWITWILCLCFLYTLICAYISGISEIFHSFFHTPSIQTSLIVIGLIAVPIYFGLKHISVFNDLIVCIMFLLLILVEIFLSHNIKTDFIFNTPSTFPLLALPIVFTAFGFTVVVPSLRIYFNNDIKQLKTAILIGTSIPVVLYIGWTTVVMGLIPGYGNLSLNTILSKEMPIQTLKSNLIQNSGYSSLRWIIEAFVLTALASSLIGLSIATFDFLADGLKIARNSIGKIKLLLLTFLPPFLITATKNHILLKALGIAGLLSTIVFGVFPLLFVWLARYKYKMHSSYKAPFSKLIFATLLAGCLIVIGIELFEFNS